MGQCRSALVAHHCLTPMTQVREGVLRQLLLAGTIRTGRLSRASPVPPIAR
jgi:hypothetical protein